MLAMDNFKGTKHQKEAHHKDAHKSMNKADQDNPKRRKRSCDDKEKQKAISIELTQ